MVEIVMVETFSDLIEHLVIQTFSRERVSNRAKPQTGHMETACHDGRSKTAGFVPRSRNVEQ